MSMTREEAIAILEQANEQLYHHQKDTSNVLAVHVLRERRTALSILAPEPRKEPLPIGDVVWLWDEFMCAWCLSKITKHGSPFAIWLPLSALPKGDV